MNCNLAFLVFSLTFLGTDMKVSLFYHSSDPFPPPPSDGGGHFGSEKIKGVSKFAGFRGAFWFLGC